MEIRELRQSTITDAEAMQLARLRSAVDPNRLRTDPPVSPQLARNGLRESVSTFAFGYFGLFDGEQLVALGETFGTVNAENTDVCELGIWVHPERLGESLHRLMFDHLDTIEKARGRTRYWGWGDLVDEATKTFWQDELGYKLAYEERISRCNLGQVDQALMKQWIDRASDRAAGYRLVRAEAPLDNEMLGYLAQGLEAMNDAPLDDLDLQHETFDVNRARDVETLQVMSRSAYRLIFAIETATGDLAGYTSMRIPEAEPALSQQGDTVTVAAHRNQGIGRWLKADMWSWLRDTRPEVEFLNTGNAESNRAMLAINEAMGFRDILHHGVWQMTT